ncbi:MAG TPA: hypothetical protein VFK04_15975 [Gemmatimonadaceae bacterium]|nr:hypothetical protein [Gemmatimonadaceae bacterium]
MSRAAVIRDLPQRSREQVGLDAILSDFADSVEKGVMGEGFESAEGAVHARRYPL